MKVYTELKGFSEGWYAGLKAAKGLIDQKKYDKAAAIVADVHTASKGHMLYESQSAVMLFGLYYELGKTSEAISLADSAISSASDEEKPEWLLAKAKLLVTSGKMDEARKVLTSLTVDHASSTQSKVAQNMLSVLL